MYTQVYIADQLCAHICTQTLCTNDEPQFISIRPNIRKKLKPFLAQSFKKMLSIFKSFYINRKHVKSFTSNIELGLEQMFRFCFILMVRMSTYVNIVQVKDVRQGSVGSDEALVDFRSGIPKPVPVSVSNLVPAHS